MNNAESRTPPKPGILAALRGFFAAVTSYLSARLRLLGTELRHAGGHFALLGIFAGALAVLAFVGYLLLVLAAVFALAAIIGGRYGAALGTLIAGLLHFAAGGVIFVLLRRKAREPVFRETIEELKKDQQCLKPNPNR